MSFNSSAKTLTGTVKALDVHVYKIAGSTSNLLANEGFESGATSWEVRGGGAAVLNSITTGIHSGSKAVSVTGRIATYSGLEQI
jgi:Carbohydrate binding domain